METNQNMRANLGQIENRVREMEQQAEERLREGLNTAKVRAQALTEQAAELVRQRPAACLIGAFAVGYIIARLAKA